MNLKIMRKREVNTMKEEIKELIDELDVIKEGRYLRIIYSFLKEILNKRG